MKTKKVELRESFAERIEILADELRLALKFDRPSILLAVYQSRYVMLDAINALAEQLRALGQQLEFFQVNDDNADIPLLLSRRSEDERKKTIYLIDGLQFGKDAALRALNIRREYFVDHRLRVVFWLTEKEAESIPLRAPDFWRFRHRVIDFFDRVEPQRAGKLAQVAREWAWAGWDDRTLREDTDAKIELRLALLKDLPEVDETLAARAELQYTLAGLYRAKREFEESIRYLNEAIQIAEQLGDTRLLSWCHNGLGNVYYDLGRYDDALAAYERAIALDPKSAYPHNGLGNVYADLGRYDEAIAAYERAIALDPKYASPHNGLGTVYYDLGRYDDALAAYECAIALDPKFAYPYANLADIYKEQGNLQKAIELYEQSFKLQPRARPRNSIGYIYLEQNELEKAAANFEEAVRLDSKDYNPVFNLGLVRARQGRAEEARTLWQKGLALCTGNTLNDKLNRALYTVTAGDAERGIVELQRILNEDKPPVWLLQGVLEDAQLLAAAPNPPAGIARVVEMLSLHTPQCLPMWAKVEGDSPSKP